MIMVRHTSELDLKEFKLFIPVQKSSSYVDDKLPCHRRLYIR